MAITKGMGQKKVKMIAKRYDISLEDAKTFYFDRKEAKLEGRALPFHKWKKQNLNFDDTTEGNDIEEGDFDNFFSRKRRRKIRTKLRRAGKRIRRVKRGILTGGLSELVKRKNIRIKRHKNLIRRLANPAFLARPKNIAKIKRRVIKMAQGIKRADERMIRMKKRMVRQPDFGFDGYSDEFSNAAGKPNLMDNIKKYKWWIVGGGVALLFFTKAGKKLISK